MAVSYNGGASNHPVVMDDQSTLSIETSYGDDWGSPYDLRNHHMIKDHQHLRGSLLIDAY